MTSPAPPVLFDAQGVAELLVTTRGAIFAMAERGKLLALGEGA